MKHYEQVKSMSVKELAEFLHLGLDGVCFEACEKATGNKFKCPHGEDAPSEKCIECLEKWLESEVKTDA